MSELSNNKHSLFNNILYVYRDVILHKPYLVALLFASMISTVGTRFVWLYMSKVVIEHIGGQFTENEFIQMVILLTIFAMIFMILQTFVYYWVDPAAYYVRPIFMLRRNQKFFKLGFENTEKHEILDSRQKSINATSWPQNGVEGLIRKTIIFASEFATCLVAMIVLGQSSPIMILIVLLFGTISYFMIDKTSALEKKYTKDDVVYEKRKEEHFTKIARDFTYGKDIRLFKMDSRIIGTIKELNLFIHEHICKARNKWIKCDFMIGSLEMIRELVMYALLVYLIIRKERSIADFTLYIGCVRNFASAYQTLAKTFAEMRNCSREVNDFRDFEFLCDSEEKNGIAVPKIKKYRFEFRNVSFKYPSVDHYALKNVNIIIESGTKLAVVGLNGAGKTTFVKLLLRLYEPTEGDIFVNDKNIKEYDKEEYYRIFAPVFQDLECFAFTLAENISMKNLEETDVKRAEEIARKVGLGNKLDEWKDGILTNVLKVLHDDGVTLSGGEMQKMGLARALYKNAPIAILDEPTAALDVMAESKMYEDFDDLINGNTAVYISHRLASTKFCDAIAMFADGSIVEYGTHQDLMKKKGRYFEMFEMQACYYRENKEEMVG